MLLNMVGRRLGVVGSLFVMLLGLSILLGFNAGTGNAQTTSSLQLTFFTLTAPHAALGAPVQWTATVQNNGSTSAAMTLTVKLIAPDATSYSLLSSTGSVKAGGSTTSTKTTTTSTYTSQTGSFQLVASVTVSGSVVASQTIPVSITAVPGSGSYVSVGGVGPSNTSFGAPTTYRIVAANLGTATTSLKTNSYLILPDGTQKTITLGSSGSYTAGSNTIKESTINSVVWGGQSGNFSVLVNLLDTSNNILSSDTYAFTRNALPATAYVPSFTDTAATAGLSLMRMMMMNPPGCGAGNSDYMPGGVGAAVADYDGDGYDDLFVIDMMGMGTLYRNNHDGTFTDVTMAAGIPMVMMQSAALWGDIDNDGRPDLLILTNSQEGMTPPVLLHNNGPNASGVVTFTDISASSGIPAAIGSTQNLQGATFGDYDKDGFVDLYITAHVDCNTANANDHLFHNNGNLTFTDRTDLLGGSANAVLNRRGLVTTFLDYNGDGKEDIYVGNDEGNSFGANVLWKNNGDGTFADVSASTGANVAISAMGIAVLDYNRDGLFDIFVSNVGSNVLLQGQANATFKQVQSDSTGAHVARRNVPTPTNPTKGLTNNVTWGTGAYDFNNDGWEDLFVAAGALSGTGIYDNVFFLNNQDGTFLDVSPLTGIGGIFQMMPTAVFADFNNDGFMDAFVFGMVGTGNLFMNNARSNGNPYNWLQVKLVGGCTATGGCASLFSNRDAIGARLVANVGTAQMWRQVVDGGTMGGNSTLIQQFGLGTATQVDSLTVYWPSGKTTTMTNIAANQKITIQEP